MKQKPKETYLVFEARLADILLKEVFQLSEDKISDDTYLMQL